MRSRSILIAVPWLLACASVLADDAKSFPAVFSSRLSATPDLLQTDPEAKFPDNGAYYCGPVAVSNSLVWLGKQGFPELVPGKGSTRHKQIELGRSLGEAMRVSKESEGTSTADLIASVRHHVEQCGYDCEKLEYQGAARLPKGMKRNARHPSLDWIKSGISRPASAAWLNLGWYRYDPQTDEYTRFSGHWVTLVGYGVDSHGTQDPSYLIVHDPSPRAGKGTSHESFLLEPLTQGTMITKTGAKHAAASYHKIKSGIRLKKGADAAILDGVVLLVVGR
jgi:hypothetical protein